MSHGVEDSLYPFCRVPTTWQCPTPPMVTSSVLQWKCAVFHTGQLGRYQRACCVSVCEQISSGRWERMRGPCAPSQIV